MSKSFIRETAKFKAEPSVLIICEDTKSSKLYLDDASVHLRANVHVELNHCGNTDPLGIVTAAIKRQNRFEFIFCVIDRDTHANFSQAVTLAKLNNIHLITSYPCFEFWLLLHFSYSTKPYNRAGKKSPADLLIEDLKKIQGMEDYNKGTTKSPFYYLLEKFPRARINSAKALAEAKENKNFNPSTTLHLIMDFFEELAVPNKSHEKINTLLQHL